MNTAKELNMKEMEKVNGGANAAAEIAKGQIICIVNPELERKVPARRLGIRV